jgi:serine/threonine protein kinase
LKENQMLAAETILQHRYRVLRQIGQGGMGSVYEAVDQRLDSTVALKETMFADERLRKQFEREARLLARLHHPALPRVSDHFAEGDGQFLVMQFIAGDNLSEMMTRNHGPFSPHQVVTWADQLLDALDYLHTQDPQIIHRDIKPQNIKLTSRGQIILLDFGLAKGQAGELSHATTSASIFGYTPNYAPLEQVQGLGTDSRSDIYSLGATLYHLMTGVKPPDALTRAAAIVNGQPDPLKPANDERPSVSADVAAVLHRAMAQNRDQRYASAGEMRKALSSSGQAVTSSGKSEADTVLFPPPATTVTASARPTQDVTRAARNQPTVLTGETTVVRSPQVIPRKRYGKIAAAAVLVLAAGFGGFYAYHHRNGSTSAPAPLNDSNSNSASQSVVTTPDTTASPAVNTEPESMNPASSEKQAIAEEQSAKALQKGVREKAAREKASSERSIAVERQAENDSEGTPTTPTTSDEGRNEQGVVQEPEVPDINPTVDVPLQGRHPRVRRLPGGAVIRNFPNGAQVVTAPDGSRVVTMPNGTTRVFRPGERINRRRRSP